MTSFEKSYKKAARSPKRTAKSNRLRYKKQKSATKKYPVRDKETGNFWKYYTIALHKNQWRNSTYELSFCKWF